MSTTPTVQTCRSCGGGAPVDVHFCPQCTKILTLVRHGDYFAFFGLPRRLNIDQDELERAFRALSRQFHPDYFYNAPPAERRASLERSSYLNDAYRTLKQPVTRIAYLLELEGFGTTGQAAKEVPPALLEEVFSLNEELEEVRGLKAGGAAPEIWKARLQQAGRPIERKRDEHEEQLRELSARWDALAGGRPGDPGDPGNDARREVLSLLRDRMLERNYINNLLAGIERELNG